MRFIHLILILVVLQGCKRFDPSESQSSDAVLMEFRADLSAAEKILEETQKAYDKAQTELASGKFKGLMRVAIERTQLRLSKKLDIQRQKVAYFKVRIRKRAEYSRKLAYMDHLADRDRVISSEVYEVNRRLRGQPRVWGRVKTQEPVAN